MVDRARGRYIERRNYGLPPEHISTQAPQQQVTPPIETPPPPKKPKKRKKLKFILLLLAILILIASSTGTWFYLHRSTSPVPKSIRQSVNFPIYYPDPKKLPAGYNLNQSSFKSINSDAIAYSVSYSNNKKLIFSVQKKPSDNELANFNKQYIPIHRQVLTLVGTATEGVIGSQTVVSLPANDSNAWIIITGPSDAYATTNLAQVLKAIRKSS